MVWYTHRPLSSSFLGLPYRILNRNHKRNYLGAYGYTETSDEFLCDPAGLRSKVCSKTASTPRQLKNQQCMNVAEDPHPTQNPVNSLINPSQFRARLQPHKHPHSNGYMVLYNCILQSCSMTNPVLMLA